LLIALLAACAGPAAAPQQPTPDVNVIVAQTLQALTAGPEAGAPPPVASAAPTLLPRALYFLNADAAAHAQVFRLAPDGVTQRQVTAEPADVESFDVNQLDGRVVYVSNNQMLLINSDGSGRQMLLDGGVSDPNTPFLNTIRYPVWSPNGQTIAFGYGGLNLYSVATGVSNRVLEDQIQRPGPDMVFPGELYWPAQYSPDGTKLLVTLAYMEGGSYAIYYPSSNTLVRLVQPESGGGVCCGARWTPDSNALYAALATTGMFSSGLWRMDASTGQVTTLLPGDPGNNTWNFADAPQIGPDGQLYFFFANTPAAEDFYTNAPLQLVRAAPDGVSGRAVLLPDTFIHMNEALWSPDATFVIAALAQTDQTYEGGQAEIIYVDGRPRVTLVPFAKGMMWGP
jgi:hypothetical protein